MFNFRNNESLQSIKKPVQEKAGFQVVLSDFEKQRRSENIKRNNYLMQQINFPTDKLEGWNFFVKNTSLLLIPSSCCGKQLMSFNLMIVTVNLRKQS